MAQDYSQEAAMKLAKETVILLEKQNTRIVDGGKIIDHNKVMGGLAKMSHGISTVPTADEIFKQRVSELAGAYANVSDGEGGMKGASKQAMEKFKNVTAGKMPDGVGYSLSQRLALMTGKAEHLVEGIKIPGKSSNFIKDVALDAVEEGAKLMKGAAPTVSKAGFAGKVIAAAGTVAFSVGSQAAETGHVSAAKVGEDVLNGTLNGSGTVLLGEGSTSNKLCKAFGEAVVPAAAGAVGLAASPLGAAAAATAASLTLSEPSTKACNFVAQKFGWN